MCTRKLLLLSVTAGASLGLGTSLALAQQGYGGPYDFGATPSAEEMAAVDIDAMPDGRGLPPGSGTYQEGGMSSWRSARPAMARISRVFRRSGSEATD